MLNAQLNDRGNKSRESYWALKGLPPFPAVATRLLELLATEDYEMHRLVDLIRADPMFASELLHATNSAKYALSKEVTSIRHAAAILGRETLRSFAVAVSLRMYMGKVGRHDLLAKIWRHSLATAVICDLLAECHREVRKDSRDDTPYVAGLLHDIGCLGLIVTHAKEYAEILTKPCKDGLELCEKERALFQIDHCAAGQWIAHSWKFPRAIGEVALLHHQAPTGAEFTLLELVKVGVRMADAMGYEVVPAQEATTLPDVAALLPPPARAKFDKQAEQLPERISERIGSFEL